MEEGDLDTWHNIRGPRPWEDSKEYQEMARENIRKQQEKKVEISNWLYFRIEFGWCVLGYSKALGLMFMYLPSKRWWCSTVCAVLFSTDPCWKMVLFRGHCSRVVISSFVRVNSSLGPRTHRPNSPKESALMDIIWCIVHQTMFFQLGRTTLVHMWHIGFSASCWLFVYCINFIGWWRCLTMTS